MKDVEELQAEVDSTKNWIADIQDELKQAQRQLFFLEAELREAQALQSRMLAPSEVNHDN